LCCITDGTTSLSLEQSAKLNLVAPLGFVRCRVTPSPGVGGAITGSADELVDGATPGLETLALLEVDDDTGELDGDDVPPLNEHAASVNTPTPATPATKRVRGRERGPRPSAPGSKSDIP
jgi:hypothetical protein